MRIARGPCCDEALAEISMDPNFFTRLALASAGAAAAVGVMEGVSVGGEVCLGANDFMLENIIIIIE